MSLVKHPVTPRQLAANRANARKSTGPRTRAGKMRSRLNALKDGTHSRLLKRYFRLWLQICVHGPSRAPEWWKFTDMPVPIYPHQRDCGRGARIHEFLWRARAYLPLRERRVLCLRDFDAEFQPNLNWGEIRASILASYPTMSVKTRRTGEQNVRQDPKMNFQKAFREARRGALPRVRRRPVVLNRGPNAPRVGLTNPPPSITVRGDFERHPAPEPNLPKAERNKRWA